ncbi:protein FAM177A1 [Xyrauchen texanus]|uniref:protein FAM177A1 n=1 Tax=Xyrauchen texanus TaxID=154827 RepID=UPI002242BFCB|nr:protein FAM177A1 [Xyrauchen texanus]
MAELSLYLTNVNVSLGQTMDTEKSSNVVKEFESVELGDLGKKQPKIPRRTIYFASGETMEEFSTDDEEEESEKKSTLSTPDPAKLTWGPYVWFQMWKVATSTISVCDYLGEKMASLLGITTPKYQYAIDEYHRMKKEEEEEEEENQLSEAAERRFDEQHNQQDQQPKIEQPEATASFVNMSFELEQESHTTPDANKVPAPIPS